MIRSIFISFLLILSVSAYAEYDKNHKCSPQTLATMKSKAEKGDVVEVHNMGDHYRYGYCSYSQDKNKAIELYEKAAVKGYVPSIEELITLHYSNKDYTKTREWCNKMLEINEYDADAYYYLALCEESSGQINIANYVLAAKYGNEQAMNKVGCIYYKDKLYQKAYEAWVNAWCSNPNEAITNNLIYCCLLPGIGCEKDYIAAARVYKLFFYEEKSYNEHVSTWNKMKNAADAGDAKACYAWYILNEDKKYFEKALAAKVPDALWEKELEKFEKKTENMDSESKEYEAEAKALFKTAMRNHWYASYIYESYQSVEYGRYWSHFPQNLAKGDEEYDFSKLSFLDRKIYLSIVLEVVEWDYLWDFIFAEVDSDIEKNNITKTEKANLHKYYLNIAEDLYKEELYQAVSLLSWVYNDVDMYKSNSKKAYKYAAIGNNIICRCLARVATPGLDNTTNYLLSKCYYEGIGTQKNRTVALSYLLNSKDRRSMELLNRIYRMAPLSKEAGVVQDIPLADYYLSESSKSGAELLKKLQNCR